MDPLTQLYERLRAESPGGLIPFEPPSLDEWMKYWNDDDSEIGNLRTFEHWLSKAAPRSRVGGTRVSCSSANGEMSAAS